jgi:copper chaperone NosL
MTRFCFLLSAAALLAVPACTPDERSGPPAIRYGLEECAECGMIISDERFAAAILVADDAGGHYLLFDDTGDLLEYERTHPGLPVRERFVHDAGTKAWVDARSAWYVLAESVQTPMGTGILAYADHAPAAQAAARHAGRLMRFADLAAARAAARAAPGDPPAGEK